MFNTPIHLNGPFTLKLEQGHHVIRGRDGVPLCELTSRLIDGSSRKAKYPDGIIRSEAARKEEAVFILAAMNQMWSALNPEHKA